MKQVSLALLGFEKFGRATQRMKNRTKSKIRARVEHVFAVIKLKFGCTKPVSPG